MGTVEGGSIRWCGDLPHVDKTVLGPRYVVFAMLET